MEEEYIFYLCDGKQLCGFGEGCHLKGGTCMHTTKPENALNGAIKDRKELKEQSRITMLLKLTMKIDLSAEYMQTTIVSVV